MLKKVLLIGFTLALLFVMVSCNNKASLNETEFTDLLEKAEYTVVDGAERFDNGDVTVAMQAVDPEERFTIEYYVFSSSEKASASFAGIKGYLSELKGTWNTSHYANFSTCRGTNNGTYYGSTCIGNTVVYVETEDANKDAVEEILKTLGYR